VFARLFDKLVAGYAYDAIGAEGEPMPPDQVLATLAGCPHRRGPSVALGEDIRMEGNGAIASGLVADGELIQLSGYGDA
jgi:hypothetical protein